MAQSILCFLAFLSLASGKFNGNGRGSNNPYTKVPHSAISEDETRIDLGENIISNISDYEFERYVNLTSLSLHHNPLQVIPDKAFARTKIRYLDLSSTELTNFPNLEVVADTLNDLNLDGNPITEVPVQLFAPLDHMWKLHMSHMQLERLPDISTMKHLHELFLPLSLSREALDEIPYSYCSVSRLMLISPRFETHHNTGELPKFQCSDEMPKLRTLYLEGFRLADSSDLTSLEIIPSLRTLYLSRNHFNKFPNFTNPTKKNLYHLVLAGCAIEEITEEDIEDFTTLYKLELVNNPLLSIPGTIFQIVKTVLTMDISPVATWNVLRWRNFLCMNITLRELTFSGANKYELVLPDLHSIFCYHSLTVTFNKVSAGLGHVIGVIHSI